jgi:Ca-activated chloride channel family protein
MRRYLEPVVAFSAAAYLALGCGGLGSADAAGTGGSESTGATAGSGTNASASGAGGGATASEASDTAPAKADPKTDIMSCEVTSELSNPIFLSIPRARSMVTATQVRGELAELMPAIPMPSTLRGPELLNYYHLDYPSTSATEVTVEPELHDTGIPGEMVLQIGIQAPLADSAHRRPTSLTVLVDTTKSMEGESMARANAAVLALAESLNKDDVLNVVTTNSDVAVVHRVATIAGDPALFPAKQPLAVSGAGDLAEGLGRAYTEAAAVESYLADGINRVVVITDGGGLPESIDTRPIHDAWVTQRIQLVGVGVGLAPSYRPALLDAATSAGHGPNLYLDSVAEAEAALHLRFDEVMDEALSDVSIGFQLPTAFQVVNPQITSAGVGEGQLATSDLGRGRSMVFRHAVTICPSADSVALAQTSLTVTLSWNDPASPERRSKPFSFLVGKVKGQKPSYPFLKTSAIIAFTNALQSLEVSRFQAACQKIADVHAAYLSHPADPELDSIAAQINAHPLMVENKLTCPPSSNP